MVPKSDVRRCAERPIVPVLGLDPQEGFHFVASALVLVAFQQDPGVVVASGPVVGCELKDSLEQEFRIIEHIALYPNSGQQPHGFDMMSMLQKIGADNVLRRQQLTVRKQAGRGDDFRGKGLESGDVCGRHTRVFRVTGQAVKPLEQGPTRR